MSIEILRIPLPPMSIGTSRELRAFRYGKAGARPKIYLQAALHADELPGQLVLHRLRRRLEAAAAAGHILGEIVLVPVANPVGLGQMIGNRHLGRYELASGENFNRNYLDLALIGDRLADRLGSDPVANLSVVREELLRYLDELSPVGELATLRRALLQLAVDADIVLDLHCDQDAEMHIYTGDLLWPQFADIAAELQAAAVLLARTSGGNPFDEAFSAAFAKLSERFGAVRPVPADGCLSATVELRGEADVSDVLAERDAAALFRVLQRRGAIAGDPGPLPPARCTATPLSGVDLVRSPAAGLIVFRVDVGARVKSGELIAEIVDPVAASAVAPPVEVRSRTEGILFARALEKLARPGKAVAKIAGAEALPDRVGHLLTD